MTERCVSQLSEDNQPKLVERPADLQITSRVVATTPFGSLFLDVQAGVGKPEVRGVDTGTTGSQFYADYK